MTMHDWKQHFGAGRSLLAAEDEGGGGSGGAAAAPEAEPFTPAQQKRVDHIAAEARRTGRGERKSQQAPREDSEQFTEDREAAKDERLAKIVAGAVAAAMNPNGQQSQSTARAPVTAPSAPMKVDPLTSHGMVDIFNLNEAQLHQLGPQGLRTEFEKALAAGRNMTGAPPMPKRPGQNR